MAVYRTALCIVLLSAIFWMSSSRAEDRHQGYYYPEPATHENYQGRAPLFEDASKRSRAALAAGIANRLNANPAAPMVAVFPKGADGEKLIMTAMRDGELDTLYRIRAFLALMTAEARASPLFAKATHPETLTFLDFLASLGFQRLTVTDGDTVAHQIDLRPAR